MSSLHVGRPSGQIPNPGGTVARARYGEPAFPGQHHAEDLPAVALEHVLTAAGDQVPHDREIVAGDRDGCVAAGVNGAVTDPPAMSLQCMPATAFHSILDSASSLIWFH